MYGLVDLEIVKEITRLMRRGDDKRQASELEPVASAHPIETAQEKPAPKILVDCSQHQAAAEC